jgi:hypothetical protein
VQLASFSDQFHYGNTVLRTFLSEILCSISFVRVGSSFIDNLQVTSRWSHVFKIDGLHSYLLPLEQLARYLRIPDLSDFTTTEVQAFGSQ